MLLVACQKKKIKYGTVIGGIKEIVARHVDNDLALIFV